MSSSPMGVRVGVRVGVRACVWVGVCVCVCVCGGGVSMCGCGGDVRFCTASVNIKQRLIMNDSQYENSDRQYKETACYMCLHPLPCFFYYFFLNSKKDTSAIGECKPILDMPGL